MAAPFDGWQRLRVVNVATQQIGHREWDPQVLAYSENNNENWCGTLLVGLCYCRDIHFLVEVLLIKKRLEDTTGI